MRIGVLGGSFNPAHEGHLHISLAALKMLRLDQVWWLVAPQNPLKPADGMAPLAERMKGARKVARHPAFRVTDIEVALGTRFTADTLAALRRRFPAVTFVWLMGADNLAQMPRWQRWKEIFAHHPVAVFDRSPYSYRSLGGRAAHRFEHRRMVGRSAGMLARSALPAWVYAHQPRHPASATEIRKKLAALAADRSEDQRTSPEEGAP